MSSDRVSNDEDILYYTSRAKNLTEAADRNWEAYVSGRPISGATQEDIVEFFEAQLKLLAFIEHERDQAQTAALLALVHETRRQGGAR